MMMMMKNCYVTKTRVLHSASFFPCSCFYCSNWLIFCHVQAESGCSESESTLSSRWTNHWIFVLRNLYQSASSMNETQMAEAECPLLDRVSMHCCVILSSYSSCLDWSDFSHCLSVDLTRIMVTHTTVHLPSLNC